MGSVHTISRVYNNITYLDYFKFVQPNYVQFIVKYTVFLLVSRLMLNAGNCFMIRRLTLT